MHSLSFLLSEYSTLSPLYAYSPSVLAISLFTAAFCALTIIIPFMIHVFNTHCTISHVLALPCAPDLVHVAIANIITPVPVRRLVIKRWANNFLFLENQFGQSILITVLSTLLTPSRNTFECQVWCSISGKTKTNKKYNCACNLTFTTKIYSCY